MNKNTGILIGVVALIVIVGGIYTSMNGRDDAMMEQEKMEQKAMEEKAMMEKKAMEEKDSMLEKETMMKDDTPETDSIMEKDETSMMDKTDTMMKVGVYEAFSPEKIARAATEDVVLFFKADWCPSCRAVDADIKANPTKIPSGLNILEVNYDNSVELKKKYGVTYQHTFVQVDAQGKLLKKWSGSGTLTALVAEVQ